MNKISRNTFSTVSGNVVVSGIPVRGQGEDEERARGGADELNELHGDDGRGIRAGRIVANLDADAIATKSLASDGVVPPCRISA